jgi:putative transposase
MRTQRLTCCGHTPLPDLNARPTQAQSSRPRQAKRVICEQAIEVTYIPLLAGWMYLVAVLDWFSRYVVSWEVDDNLQLPCVLRAVERALAQATPEIWNSDQGSHFTSPQYRNMLLAAGVQISTVGKGRALDNIFVERLWRSVKYEEVYPNSYASPREARAGLTRYLTFYNHERPHQALAYRTPAEVYFLSSTSRSSSSSASASSGEARMAAAHVKEGARA